MQSVLIGIKGGFDTYSYIGQNPINFNDSLGLKSVNYENCLALINLIMKIKLEMILYLHLFLENIT